MLKASEQTSRLRAYIVLSLLTGARTEEMRALRWCDVDLAGNPDADPPIPPNMALVALCVRGGDTKTRKSRRTLAMAQRCVDALPAVASAQVPARPRMRLPRLPVPGRDPA